MIHVLAKISIKPAAAGEAATLLTNLVVESRKEPGNRSYALFQQTDNPGEFRTVEEWADQAAADAHLKTPHIAAVVAAATPLSAEPVEIKEYELLI